MLNRFLLALLILTHSAAIAHANGAANEPKRPAHNPLPRPLDTRFERYVGGSAASEAKLIRSLASKFALIQAGVAAKTGKIQRGTHAKGFCLTGKLEIYKQKPADAWLHIGPFKTPLAGDRRPTVRIRFADASGVPQSNQEKDVRAISFSFEVAGKRQDFSMNNDPVFAIRNLADFDKVLSFKILAQRMPQSSEVEKLRAFSAVNPDMGGSVARALGLGKRQMEKHVYAYHTENYYSGSAFTFGKNRAAQFSLVRAGGLPPVSEPMPKDACDKDFLVRRTVAVVNGEAVPDPKKDRRGEFCFELQVHILDPMTMTLPAGWPKNAPQPTAADWVEDATLDWIKAGAKTYKLGKLTAVPNSVVTGAECDRAPGFDVNTNRWDELTPLGSINRGRYLSERQSQRLRAKPTPEIRQATKAKHTKTIDQGWDDQDRDIFWYISQGSYIIPYNWFLELNDPETKKPLRDGLARFGFIHADYGTRVSDLNRDKLPIGLTRELPPASAFPKLRNKGDWLGITCAACHVGSVTVEETRYIIDGAPSILDFEKFSLAVERSLVALDSEAQFKTFKDAVERRGSRVTRKDVQAVRQRLTARKVRSFLHQGSKSTVNAGPGRTDAFGVILNEVVSRSLGASANAKTASAPVSFPQLWGAPAEEWVQYSGLSNNAFTRNVGQVFGVLGDVVLDPNSDNFLATTARFRNLLVIEEKLRSLKPPRWEQVFGEFSASEYEQVKRGEALFSITCAECHSEDPAIVTMVPLSEFARDLKRRETFVGTDPLYFLNLASSWGSADAGLLKGKSVMRILGRNDPGVAKQFGGPSSPLSERFSIRYREKENAVKILADVTMGVALKYMAKRDIPMDPANQRYKYLSGGMPPKQQTQLGAFKARSLEGIAFTGPYFHNGSVRTLREVISPEIRSTDFYVGGTGFDKENGGFENAGKYHFRANKLGNLNIGHDFAGDLTETEKEDLLMYLKSL